MVDKLFIPVRSEKIASRLVGEEAVIIILEKQESIVLNESGAFIWENCDGKNSIEEIASGFADCFEVSLDAALNDCLEFVATMLDKEALIINKT